LVQCCDGEAYRIGRVAEQEIGKRCVQHCRLTIIIAFKITRIHSLDARTSRNLDQLIPGILRMIGIQVECIFFDSEKKGASAISRK
jgi:hypothetical protein